MVEFEFHPIIRKWFDDRFGSPTEPQRLGWPSIAAARHTLIAAPTGSGKTLAAFLVCLDRLLREWLEGTLDDRIRVVYISPLKALSNDIQRNLEQPLEEIRRRTVAAGHGTLPIRTMVRTGDTPSNERQKMLRRPPHILVTTPESLYLLLTSAKSRECLRSVGTVIVDEIHALARDKRGSHLSLSLERLEAICDRTPVRVGLSATQRPIDQIANFLVGARRQDSSGHADCAIVDVGHLRQLDIAVDVPPSPLNAICSHDQWSEIYERLADLIQQHRSTLIFVNTRRLAERIAYRLTDTLSPEAVASHHGSLSRRLRHDAEQRLKDGTLQVIVATASLEMGIDIGFIDLVCQIGSPRSIAAFLQRVGRSGHSLGVIPKGRIFPLTRDELIECLSLVRAVRRGNLDRIDIPTAPLDILAQQLVATVACEDWEESELLALCRGAWPYRDLSRDAFDSVVKMVSEGVAPGSRRGAHLHRDGIGRRLRARRGARISAVTSGGAIPETAEYRVVTELDRTYVGTVDEDFAIESQAGDIFLLGNTSWRIRYVRAGEVVVQDAQGAPPNIPFWFGEAPGRTVELSAEVSSLREQIATGAEEDSAAFNLLQSECGAGEWAARQACDYVQAGQAALGLVPTNRQIVFERFFDESGGMQLVIHSPLGARINRAWGLALRKRFCRSFDFELQASADDDGIVLSLSPQHSFPIENLFRMIGPHNARELLEQALLPVPMFQIRWRWNVTRSLAVLRQRGGKKVPPYLQRFQSDDLMAAVFPETVGCLENHSGNIPIPEHPLVKQTMHDCMHEAMDLEGWLQLLDQVQSGDVQLVARDTREPSPFSHELLNANPYAFLDPAPLEERRTRAVTLRRSLSPQEMQNLGQLDPRAIERVSDQAWPLVRDEDELHDALMSLIAVTDEEVRGWTQVSADDRVMLAVRNRAESDAPPTSWLDKLVGRHRAARVQTPTGAMFWVAAERWPVIIALYPGASADPPVTLPDDLQRCWERTGALVELLRGRLQHTGPVTARQLADTFSLEVALVAAALEALEGEGSVLRGRYTSDDLVARSVRPGKPAWPIPLKSGQPDETQRGPPDEVDQWCDRRLLARIHRLTLDALREQIQPVEPSDYVRFLVRHHHLLPDQKLSGPGGVRKAIQQLQGFQMPAGAWERQALEHRTDEYDPRWLDHLFLSGESVWGRLCPPRRTDQSRQFLSAMTRTVPISLMLREDLPWLLPVERSDAERLVRPAAQQVLETLDRCGALFSRELLQRTELLSGHLEEALRELAAAGLVTADGWAAVRAFVAPKGTRGARRRRPSRHRVRSTASPSGRWSLFPGSLEIPARSDCLELWCRQLLRRYGVVFRDLMARETTAPRWYELVPVFRRLERQGEVRGGRFIVGVAGEQFGSEESVQELRKVHEQRAGDPWIVVSAADPLNLVGILTPASRVPATHKNSIIIDNGHYVAAKEASQVEFFEAVSEETSIEMMRALRRCRRVDVEQTWGVELGSRSAR